MNSLHKRKPNRKEKQAALNRFKVCVIRSERVAAAVLLFQPFGRFPFNLKMFTLNKPKQTLIISFSKDLTQNNHYRINSYSKHFFNV